MSYRQELVYKTTTRGGYREYHSDAEQCAFCLVRHDCTTSQNMKKAVTRHIYSETVERTNMMQVSPHGRKTYLLRSETIEQSFADAK
ncbi:transposase [Vibrio comitans]